MLLSTARNKKARRSAFTLLEVLVVVAILVILATVATVATTRYIEDAKKAKAQLGCKGISQAIESYRTAPGNPTNDDPSSLNELVHPQQIGGTSFLKNGQDDLVDPWGQQYQMKQIQQGDGTMTILVYTHSKNDGVPISQYGVGPLARVGN
jgi:general secretion pathway protein G